MVRITYYNIGIFKLLAKKSSDVTRHTSIDEFMRKYPSRVVSPMIFSQKDYSRNGRIPAYPYSLMSFAIADDTAQ